MDQPITTTFAELSEITGQAAALNLCEQLGGETIYIRKTADSSETTQAHFAAFCGPDAMDKLHARLGGKRCYIPKAPPELLAARNAEIVQRMKDGESVADVAATHQLTPRAVTGIFNGAKQGDRQ